MKISRKEDKILECLRLESNEELGVFQRNRLIYWDDFSRIIDVFYTEINEKHDAEYIDSFCEEMKDHSRNAKKINAALKDVEKILEY